MPYDALKAAGTEAIYPPGTVIAEAAEQLMNSLLTALSPALRNCFIPLRPDLMRVLHTRAQCN